MADHSEAELTESQAPNEEPDMDETEPEDEFSDHEDDEEDEDDDDEDEDDDDDDDDDDEDPSLDDQESSNAEGADQRAQAPDAVQGSGNLDTDGLSINIDFNLGHGMVRIADLRTLTPGYVFNLEEEPGAEVSIIAGGQEVGRGEIVQVAERLGIRIVSLKGGSDA